MSRPCRDVPIFLESIIDIIIQFFFDVDLMGPINGRSKWISLPIPVLKGNVNVRICVNKKWAKQVIIKEKYLLLTMELLIRKYGWN